MPRNGSGVMSWPPNGDGVPSTPIDSSKFNAFRADLLADLNAARPVTAGGTGSVTAVGGNDNLNAAGASMASGATVNLAIVTGMALTITGTATISSFGTVAAGAERVLTFASALTLNYNATSLILPGAADILTAGGDIMVLRSLGGGNWKCVSYQRAASLPFGGFAKLISDWRAIINNGWYMAYQGLNAPDALNWYIGTADVYDAGNYRTLTVYNFTAASAGNTMAYRCHLQAGVWGAWYKLQLSQAEQDARYVLQGSGFRNLKVSISNATQAVITADAIWVEDANSFSKRLGPVNVTATITNSGANGLDTGSEAANTWYYGWVAWNGSTAIGLISASATAPTLPAGYTHKALVSAFRNDASSNFWRMIQYGRRAQIVVGSNPAGMPLMASGAAGNIGTPTWVAISTANFVPPTAFAIRLSMVVGQEGVVMLAPNASYGNFSSNSNPPINGGYNPGGSTNVMGQANIVLEASTIQWASTGAFVFCHGWELNI